MAVCRPPVLTDLRVPAPTTSRQVLMVLLLPTVPLLSTVLLLLLTGLRYQPTGTQVCPSPDRWEESSDLDPLTATRCTPGKAPDMSSTPGVPRRHISVPHRLTTSDRCPRHTGSVDLWDHVPPCRLTCASQDHATTPGNR